jgi:toxin FitB
MTRIILLDTGPLGYVTHPNDTGDIGSYKKWLEELRAANVAVKVPQIADYELRRKLIHIRSAASIALLNKLIRSTGGLVRIGIRTMQKACELWAQSRWEGRQTGKDEAIDGDMILCAQALLLAKNGDTVEVATCPSGQPRS